MHLYTEENRLETPLGNNAIAYAERMALGSQGKLFLPRLVEGTIDDLALGNEIVFEELENGKLHSCLGLNALLQITHGEQTIYIMDNHNHALYFRYLALQNNIISRGATLLHVDQHADMNQPSEYIDKEKEHEMNYIAEYVNTKTQIASFIEPALHSGLLGESVQIRSEAKLEEVVANIGSMSNYIVDIDIDFFAHETDISSKITLLQALIKDAKLVTIATSPYFIDQTRAIEIVKTLLARIDK